MANEESGDERCEKCPVWLSVSRRLDGRLVFWGSDDGSWRLRLTRSGGSSNVGGESWEDDGGLPDAVKSSVTADVAS
jgi:hypothetical protein